MADILTGVRQLIQDLVAPDLKAHQAGLASLQQEVVALEKHLTAQDEALLRLIETQVGALAKAMELQYKLLGDRIEEHSRALAEKMDYQYATVSRTIELQHDTLAKSVEAFRAEMRSEFLMLKSANQLEVLRQTSPLSERLTVVEKRG